MANLQQLELDFSLEIWKDITGYEGLYQISNLGRVKSLESSHYCGRYGKSKRVIPENIRKSIIEFGYVRICLAKQQKLRSFSVHGLVAEHFIGNRQKGFQVNHIDGNKQNNCVDNLEWVTQTENMQHAVCLGLVKTRSESVHAKKIIATDKNGNSKTYGSLTDAAIELKVYVSNIYKCANGKYKTTGGYSFKYV